LAERLDELALHAGGLSRSELSDLAAELARRVGPAPARAALVAASPAELEQGLLRLRSVLAEGTTFHVDADAGQAVSVGAAPPTVGLLFPGQGSRREPDGGALARRFAAVRALYDRARLPQGDPVDTAVAQPAIVAASLAGLWLLKRLNVRASVAVGHSLG